MSGWLTLHVETTSHVNGATLLWTYYIFVSSQYVKLTRRLGVNVLQFLMKGGFKLIHITLAQIPTIA